MKRILVPTDFSTNAMRALEYVVQLLKEEEVEFIILNSFEAQMSTSASRVDIGRKEHIYDQLQNEAEAQLKSTLDAIQPMAGPNHKFETQTTTQLLYKRMNKMIKSFEIDLIVMGSKGRTEAREIFMGSNTLQVLNKVKGCPVITVPLDYEFQAPTSIALASDFKREYSPGQLDVLQWVGKTFDASISILYIAEEDHLSEEQKENRATLEKAFSDIDYRFVWLPETQSEKSDIIHNYATENGIDLLSMLFYRHNFFDRLFREKVVKKIGFKTEVPFMIIPEMD